ncbi:hypothetical protein [Aestuariispira ectoiniformans]|uniref:hypothetical protein n=1 Tax=Aestuariispira ectoiniformans TaxID=2775080 RepID=UPI00223C23D9|nr:hypothetical protein [Aestuariispira ectoiniformans]
MQAKQNFEDRGVYVGLRAKGLETVRCRKAKAANGVFEALVVNWSGDTNQKSAGDLVMPFRDLPHWRPLIPFDDHLFHSVQDYGTRSSGYMDPIVMRELRLKTILRFGHVFEACKAERTLAGEGTELQETFLEILCLFSRKYGRTIGDRDLQFVTRDVLHRLIAEDMGELTRLARRLAHAVADLIGMDGNVLARRIEFYSEFGAPICSLLAEDKTRAIGYLSRQLGDLEHLVMEIQEYGLDKKGELAVFIDRILDNALKFISFTLAKATQIHDMMLDNRAYINEQKFKELRRELTANRLYISFALDGWGSHGKNWELAKLEGPEACRDFIISLYRTMPHPTKELENTLASIGYDMRHAGLRAGLVRVLHSWDDETLDQELAKRVEEGRQRQESRTEEQHPKKKKAAAPPPEIEKEELGDVMDYLSDAMANETDTDKKH